MIRNTIVHAPNKHNAKRQLGRPVKIEKNQYWMNFIAIWRKNRESLTDSIREIWWLIQHRSPEMCQKINCKSFRVQMLNCNKLVYSHTGSTFRSYWPHQCRLILQEMLSYPLNLNLRNYFPIRGGTVTMAIVSQTRRRNNKPLMQPTRNNKWWHKLRRLFDRLQHLKFTWNCIKFK